MEIRPYLFKLKDCKTREQRIRNVIDYCKSEFGELFDDITSINLYYCNNLNKVISKEVIYTNDNSNQESIDID